MTSASAEGGPSVPSLAAARSAVGLFSSSHRLGGRWSFRRTTAGLAPLAFYTGVKMQVSLRTPVPCGLGSLVEPSIRAEHRRYWHGLRGRRDCQQSVYRLPGEEVASRQEATARMRKVPPMRLRSAILLTAVASLAACSGRDTTLPASTFATASSSSPSTSSAAVAPKSVTTSSTKLVTTTASPTTAAVQPTTEQPTTVQSTAPTEMTLSPTSDESRSAAALAAAQALVDAFAGRDWAAARMISPQTPEWSDQWYAADFAGLDKATVYLQASDATEGHVDMWLAEVTNETRPWGSQTTIYCVHWAYAEATRTIARIASVKERSVILAIDPAVMGDGPTLHVCARFDTDPARAIVPELDGFNPYAHFGRHNATTWTRVNFDSQVFACSPVKMSPSDYDCVQDFGGRLPSDLNLVDVRCTRSGDEFQCVTDSYYPSELNWPE